MNEFILNFTPTGMIPTKELNKNTPISVNEVIESALEAAEIGASMVHIHARDEITGMPTVSEEVYGRIITGIRKYSKELILCASLSGRNVAEPKQRANPLMLEGDAKPDMGSLTLSSMNFIKKESVNSPETIKFLAEKMKEKLISPELEIFDLGMANYANVLKEKKLIPPKSYANVILGNIFSGQPSFANISAILSNMPKGVKVCFGGIGTYQTRVVMHALASNNGVRIGLEDNIWYDVDKKIPASNSSLLKRVIYIAETLDLQPAKPIDVRSSLGLAPGYGKYGLVKSY